MNSYLLMRKDVPVCEFSIRVVDENRAAVELVRVLDEKRMPLEMQIEPNMAQFLIRRIAPTVYSQLGRRVLLEGKPLVSNLEGIIEFTGGFSLVDDFWMLRKDDKTKSWGECNLFSNEFSEEIADISFSGEGTYEIEGFVRSPEFTTDGMHSKAWRRVGGATLLYKGGPSWGGQYGTQQLIEFYAAQIARRLDFKHVDYDLDTWMGELCSVCELFTSEKYSYVAAKRLYFDIVDYIRDLDRDSSQYREFADILLFDSLAVNTRHFGNFGFIQDNDTMEVVGLAPIFDNGAALFGNVHKRELKKPVCRSLFYFFHDTMYAVVEPDVVKALLTERQRVLAKGMTDFKFEKHREFNMEDERLAMLESIIQDRARFLSEE